MTTVVQAKCPGCKHTLNIPADWVRQAVRCKHCGMVLQTKQAARPAASRPAVPSRTPPPVSRKLHAAAVQTAPAAPPLAVTVAAGPAYPQAILAPVAHPAALAAIPLAVTAVPVAAGGGSPFDALDAEQATAAAVPARYRRNPGGWWKGPAVAVGVLLVAGVVAFLAWPYIRGAFQLSTADLAQGEPGQTDMAGPAAVEKPRPPETPVRPKDPPRAKDKEMHPGDPAGKDKSGRPKGNLPPRDDNPKPVETPRPSEPPKNGSAFPRRALVISVQNYLYANPIHAGMPIVGAHNIPNFLEALNRGLHIPMSEMAQLSDGASKGARPPMKAVIQKTLTDFLDSSRAQDRILVFFIGHAVAIGDETYLAPIEGELDNAETLIPLKWVYEQLAKCKARQKVLVMDVNRLNPSQGLERPNGGPMDPKEDAALKAPPEGVQVWTACLAGQQSYELDDAPMGLFLDKLYTALAPTKGEKGMQGKIQRQDAPLPVEELCDLVNTSLKEELTPYKLEQQSRVVGAEPKEGATYDAAEAPAPPAAQALAAAPSGGSPKDIQSVLDEVGTPSIKLSREDSGIHFEVLPPFPAEKMAQYPAGGEPTEEQKKLRDAILQARAVMWALNTAKAPAMLTDAVAKERKELQVSLAVMKDGYRKPSDDAKFKASLLNDEKDVATMMAACSDALDALKDAGDKGRDKETKRWQANYDFTLARLEAQYAYLFEYQSMLGQMRKQLPDLAPGQTGWKLASQPTLHGDSQGKKLAKESNKLLAKIIQDDPGTPWEVLAKREKLTGLGLEWQGSNGE